MPSPKRLRPTLLLALLLPAALAAADASTPRADGGMSEWFRGLWRALPQTANACSREAKGDDWFFDYGLPGGGMRTFYCYLHDRASFAELERAAPMPVFLSGPHAGGKLDLRAPGSFGHYNPDFVRWLGRAAIPREDDAATRAATLPIYRARVQPLARIYYVTYQKMKSNPRWLEHEKRALQQQLKHAKRPKPDQIGAMYYEQYALFMNPGFFAHPHDDNWLMDHGFDGGWECNVVKTAVGFWLRRSLDGTDEAFFADLKQLLAAYDPEFLADPQPPAK